MQDPIYPQASQVSGCATSPGTTTPSDRARSWISSSALIDGRLPDALAIVEFLERSCPS